MLAIMTNFTRSRSFLLGDREIHNESYNETINLIKDSFNRDFK